jgi:hypothetical protein
MTWQMMQSDSLAEIDSAVVESLPVAAGLSVYPAYARSLK